MWRMLSGAKVTKHRIRANSYPRPPCPRQSRRRSATRYQAWRRGIHENPELLYDVHRTAAFVADRLREFGCDEVATGLGRTGVVGVIRGRKPVGNAEVKVIGLRADMDALPIEDEPICLMPPKHRTRCTPASMTGIPPCCSAPPAIWPDPEFRRHAMVIFHRVEEGGATLPIIKDGLSGPMAIDQVYGMHNGKEVGSFASGRPNARRPMRSISGSQRPVLRPAERRLCAEKQIW